MAASPLISKDLISGLKSAHNTREFSDMIIQCHGKKFEVHRIIVCLQSAVFKKMMKGDFKESETCVVELPNDEPFIVGKMIEFMYKSDYDDKWAVDTDYVSISSGVGNSSKKDTNTKSSALTLSRSNTKNTHSSPSESTSPSSDGYIYEPLVTNAKVYIIGDVYDILTLKELAKKKYQGALIKDWNTPSFSESLEEIYENTQYSDRSIKEVALKIAKENLSALLDRGEFASLMKQRGEILYDIVRYGADVLPAGRTYACHNENCKRNGYPNGYPISCGCCRQNNHIRPN